MTAFSRLKKEQRVRPQSGAINYTVNALRASLSAGDPFAHSHAFFGLCDLA
jgi:hypothetical protein